MIFWDLLYGPIDFRGVPRETLLRELIATPEMQRLRHMRLMNFDVPNIQDLASAKRFPHSVGTCHLALCALRHSSISEDLRNHLLAAALIHDIGIPPFGHLVETYLKKRDRCFSHEQLVKSILRGTYHPANIYHQILPSQSLEVSSTLRRHGLDPGTVFSLLAPEDQESTAISADIDLDNIDNVHRMAALLGFPSARRNLEILSANAIVERDLRLTFKERAVSGITHWELLRRRIYENIIAHPACVAYNAFQCDLVDYAVENELITAKDWYISDAELIERLKEAPVLGRQLLSGCRYTLVDYVWFRSFEHPDNRDWKSLTAHLTAHLPPLPTDYVKHFFWPENKLITRKMRPRIENKGNVQLGKDSTSLLIALVMPEAMSQARRSHFTKLRSKWRSDTVGSISDALPDWPFNTLYPEDYDASTYQRIPEKLQLELF